MYYHNQQHYCHYYHYYYYYYSHFLVLVLVAGLSGQFAAMCALGIRLWDGSYALPAGQFLPTASIPSSKPITSYFFKPHKLLTSSSVSVSATAGVVDRLRTLISGLGVTGRRMTWSEVVGNSEKWFVLASLLSYCYVTHYNVSVCVCYCV